ncbi:MAG: response regulator, partial [Verrucomicrobiae bacterium]|nr:response regulator [Verrucomicrobiae bacterium]
GMEAAMEIRNMRADVPIILASGYAETEDLKRFENNNTFGFLHKPYERKALMDVMRKALEPA